MSYEGVPGLVETRDVLGETTLVIDPARLVEACSHLREEHGFDLLLDITATDYLGWGNVPVAGYIGTQDGRNLNYPAAQGYARTPEPKQKRFTLSYHLLRVADDSARVRVQVWLDDGETVETVIPVWPTADWHEREAWDMMGIAFDGHPNPVRILMDDDWEGHPLRKDYPIGGEDVDFTVTREILGTVAKHFQRGGIGPLDHPIDIHEYDGVDAEVDELGEPLCVHVGLRSRGGRGAPLPLDHASNPRARSAARAASASSQRPAPTSSVAAAASMFSSCPACAFVAGVTIGSGSHSPTYVSRRTRADRSWSIARRVTTADR